MTPEEKQIEIEKIYDSVIFSVEHTFEQAYEKLLKYQGKYKKELSEMFTYDLRRIYCGGYYKYEKKTDRYR